MNSKNFDLFGNMEDENGKILKYPPSLRGMALMVSLELIQSHTLRCVLEKKVFICYMTKIMKDVKILIYG